MHARMHVKLNKYELHGCFMYNMVARFAIYTYNNRRYYCLRQKA